MKFFLLSLTLPLLVSPAIGSAEALTSTEARAQVESEMAAKKAKQERKRSELLSVPAESETAKPLADGGTIRLRRVAPPRSTPARLEAALTQQRKWTETELTDFLHMKAERKPPLNISLSVTVYDGEISEIRLWHEGEVYHVLSNVPFSHLQGLGWFEDEQAQWSLVTMVEEVDEKQEMRMAEQSRRLGADHLPRNRPDLGDFTTLDEPEYLVYPEGDQPIPKEAFAKLDALHAYYLANEEDLAVLLQRRAALAEAQRRYREENPPEPEDIVINFWRESEE